MKVLRSFLILSIAILGFSFVNVEAQSFSNDGEKTQQQIEKKVYKQILKLPYYGVFDSISFDLDGSTVTLTGKVNNSMNRKDAERNVLKVEGVKNVVNNIEVLPTSFYDNTIRRRTVISFERTGNIYRYLQGFNPSIRIIVEDGHLTLEGYVRTEGDHRLAGMAAKTVSGTYSVTNNLEVTKDEKY